MANNFLKNVDNSTISFSSQGDPIAEALSDNIQAFTLVGAQTTIPNHELRAIAMSWALGLQEKRRNNTVEIAKALCQFSWSWDAFGGMVNVLLRDDLWPMPWHHYEKKIKSGQNLDEVRAKLLVQTARTAAASIRSSKSKSFTTMLSLEGWHLYTDSEVGAHYVNEFVEYVRISDPLTWPPFYPGDLSAIKTGDNGVSPCVYTRFGKFWGLGVSKPFWAD